LFPSHWVAGDGVGPARRLVVLDVDSTLTRDEGIDVLAGLVSPQAARLVAEITTSAMRGETDFEESLRARVALLEGASSDIVDQAVASIRLTEGARELVSALHEEGHLVGAVSGGFHQMIDPVAKDLGLDFHRANVLQIQDGFLTGALIGEIIDAEAKARTLREWAQMNGVDMSHTVAVGDGGNDVVMLKQAGLGIAFMAKPIAREAADVTIGVPDLRLVLEAMGLAR
jgi:phosphoserine phosphatase